MSHELRIDTSALRVHDDPEAGLIARSVQAQAFTYGNDIYFAPGRYQPSSRSGQRVLAHELSHVAAQRSGTESGGAGPLSIGRADDPDEAAADRSADRVVNALRRSLIPGPAVTATDPYLRDSTPVRSHVRRSENDTVGGAHGPLTLGRTDDTAEAAGDREAVQTRPAPRRSASYARPGLAAGRPERQISGSRAPTVHCHPTNGATLRRTEDVTVENGEQSVIVTVAESGEEAAEIIGAFVKERSLKVGRQTIQTAVAIAMDAARGGIDAAKKYVVPGFDYNGEQADRFTVKKSDQKKTVKQLTGEMVETDEYLWAPMSGMKPKEGEALLSISKNPSTNGDLYVYHSTTLGNLVGIQASGINPALEGTQEGGSCQIASESDMKQSSIENSKNVISVAVTHKVIATYLGQKMDRAEPDHDDRAKAPTKTIPMLLRFKPNDVPNRAEQNWRKDPDDKRAYQLVNQAVPADAIEVLSVEGWVKLATLQLNNLQLE